MLEFRSAEKDSVMCKTIALSVFLLSVSLAPTFCQTGGAGGAGGRSTCTISGTVYADVYCNGGVGGLEDLLLMVVVPTCLPALTAR
jgi:hypothetical protein